MATARELLEQADALMRRNRADAVDDIPVLTEAVSAVELPRVLRAPAPPMDAGPDSVPLLTENIDVVDVDEDDVTMGREAVEGEPSAWLEFEDDEPSVIGDAPDSIAIVPPVRLRPPPDEALLASAEHEEIELTLPREEANGGAEFADPAEADALVAAAVEAAAREVAAREVAAREAAAREAAAREVAAREAAAREAAAREAAAREAAARDTAEAATAIPVALLAAGSVATGAIAGAAVVPGALSMANDDERWVAAAEEIRMQVLQRIDLFTDTGLRDQLAERLQPIADRASADFVAAINLHVGDLLRTYVAEAIEREIERWRRDH